MGKLNYNRKKILKRKIHKAKIKAKEIFQQRMELQNAEASFEEIEPIIREHSNQLLLVETLQSRLDAIGKNAGIAEYSIPKFNN